ncbi:MAG TPA: MlaD family protein [Blastocatellia bacterium]|jgi:phospholipid/cholesterol/gamma-HCH transport system substrate-binding protein|nr:MlaD family protein [Blastocatellia bacterium]
MAQRKQTSFSELRVGILVLSALAILVLVIFAVSGDIKLPGLSRSVIVRTQMATVDGLRKGAEVRLSGKKVGSVREINFNQIPKSQDAQNNIEIVMEIDGMLDGTATTERIRTDSKAVLKSAGVLGDNVIDIIPGTSAGASIQNGDVISSSSQKSVGDIINAAQTAVGNLNEISADIKFMTGSMREGKGSIGKFLNDESFYVNLDGTVRQAEKLLADVRDGKGTLGQLATDQTLYKNTSDTISRLRAITDQVGDQLNSGKGSLGKLLKDEKIYNDGSALMARLSETSSRLDGIVAKIERGEGSIGKLVTDEKVYNDARDTIGKLNLIMARLEKGEGTMGMMLKDEKLYHNANNLSAEVTKLLYDFRQNPRKYLSVKVAIF